MKIARHVLGLERERRPDILPAAIEARIGWENTDYVIRAIVQQDVTAQQTGIRAEPVLPDAVTENHDLIFSRLVFIGPEGTSENGLDAEDIEIGRRYARAAKLQWILTARERDRSARFGGDVSETRCSDFSNRESSWSKRRCGHTSAVFPRLERSLRGEDTAGASEALHRRS